MLKPDDLLSLKHERIAAIHNAGTAVIYKVIRFGLSETEDWKVEASLIDMVNHIKPGHLTNVVSGHGVAESNLATADL